MRYKVRERGVLLTLRNAYMVNNDYKSSFVEYIGQRFLHFFQSRRLRRY